MRVLTALLALLLHPKYDFVLDTGLVLEYSPA